MMGLQLFMTSVDDAAFNDTVSDEAASDDMAFNNAACSDAASAFDYICRLCGLQ